MIHVLIADDHEVVRRGLKDILESERGMRVVAEAASGTEAIALASKTRLDAIVLDISMPGMSGLDALKELKVTCPNVPVLILSIYPEEQYAVRVLKAGAAGYLTKDTAPEELVAAVRKVISGRKYVSPTLAERLARELEEGIDKQPHERLSDREFQLLLMIARGRTVSEIALELSLSVKTVSTYRSRVLEKMGMRNNAEIMRYVMDRNLLS